MKNKSLIIQLVDYTMLAIAKRKRNPAPSDLFWPSLKMAPSTKKVKHTPAQTVPEIPRTFYTIRETITINKYPGRSFRLLGFSMFDTNVELSRNRT
jgi:hypothetical protein